MAIQLQLQQYSPTAMQLQDENFKVIVDRPEAKGGTGKGLMGGQYLLLGIAGCFCSNLFAAAQAREIELAGVTVNVTAEISTSPPQRFTDVILDVSYAQCSDPDSFPKLIQIAEKGCISVNTVKNGLSVQINSPSTADS